MSKQADAAKLADAASRKTIEQRLDLNILVEAGAGSGKTHSLANRMAAGIVCGKYEVEQLAAVTFTRKAAAELRGRFQLALEKRLLESQGGERARIQKALGSLEHLFAGTIHSFCAHLLRERPVEANVAPGFTELDELQDEEARERAWRDYLSRLRGQHSPLLHELQRARVSAKDLDCAFRTVCTFDEVDFPPGNAAEPDVQATRKATDAFWKKLQALMPRPVPAVNKCDTLERARKFGGLLRAAGSGRPADLAEALQCWENPPSKFTMKWWGCDAEGRAKVQDLIAAFQGATVLPFLSAWRHYVYRLAMTLLTDAREFAREERRRALTLNYDDLLSAAAALLRGNASVRRALQKKYRWLLVDEFQDTDPIQAEVMLLLAADEEGGNQAEGTAPDPYALRLRPGALFVVGDPKQSIYRFRRADIDVYNRVRETIKRSGGEVLPLTTSFRARPSLCGWNNDVFSQLLPAETTAHQAAFKPLDPDPAWKPQGPWPKGERGLRTLTAPEDAGKGAAANGQVAAWDADAIARYIRGQVDAKRAVPADFLVLTRKRKRLGVYAGALQAQQVPVEVTGAGAFGGSLLVRALVDLLRALGDPGDALALVGVLRGPLFGISDRQLFEHRQSRGYFGLSAALPAAEPATPVTRALQRLGEFLRLARKLPLPAAVERIIEDTGFLALAASAGAAGPAPAGDVLHAVDVVRAAAEDGGTLADAADALEQAAESSEVESVPLEPGRRDVVRVMNLHKAKGLEARVVFLADPLGAPKKSADVRIVREGALARGYLALSKKVGEYGTQLIAHPEGWDEHEAAEMAYVLAEETRLLYVAATRARELLVVSRWEKEGNGRPWAALDSYLDDAPELAVPTAKPAPAKAHVDLSVKARTAAAEARARRREEASRPSWAANSVTGTKAEGGKAGGGTTEGGSTEGGKAGGGTTEGGMASVPAGLRLDAGPAWGSLVHGLLEHAGRHPDASRADFERLARWLTVESPELHLVLGDAVDLVERVVNAPFWEDVRAGGDVLVEVPFGVRLAAGESLGGVTAGQVPTVVQGVIDLVHRAGDGWRIMDYKTDLASDDDAALVARHGPQLATYRLAWERTTRAKVTAIAIVALRSLRVVSA